ncbi:MAG: hypothetical protein CMC97_05275 [Flavobacteriales bacterium]|nr:hypothetical protein [Flavobacteriales bacterium]
MTTLPNIIRPVTEGETVTEAPAIEDVGWGLMAEFETPAQIMAAAKLAKQQGFRWWDTHTPYPVHGLDKAMGIKPTILPLLVMGGGSTGFTVGFLLQWFTNATNFDFWALVPIRGYDFLISGKPLLSTPAWIPVMFELTILLSALGCVGGLLLLCGLPQLYHPTLRSTRFARATDDRFFLVIEAKDPKFHPEKTRSFLESLNPLSIEMLGD